MHPCPCARVLFVCVSLSLSSLQEHEVAWDALFDTASIDVMAADHKPHAAITAGMYYSVSVLPSRGTAQSVAPVPSGLYDIWTLLLSHGCRFVEHFVCVRLRRPSVHIAFDEPDLYCDSIIGSFPPHCSMDPMSFFRLLWW